MINNPASRYFDISTLLVLGLAAMLLLSIPGGCWSDDDGDDESLDDDVEAVAEPTAPPTLEIVEPEPGDINASDPPEEEGEGDGEDETGDSSEDEAAGEPGEQDEEAAPEDGSYVVQEGDTLYDIAVEFGVTMEDLMAANGIEDPNSLQVGQELQIP